MPRVGWYCVNYRISRELRICSGRSAFRASLVLISCLALTRASTNQLTGPQLSIHRYDVADGLAHSGVRCIHQDSKGYLWVGTQEGLSRFDGYGFTNYGPRDGLGHPYVNAIAEDRQGRLWLGTNGGGVSRLIDDPQLRPPGVPPETRPRFINFLIGDSIQSNSVNRMLFDRNDSLWCVTDAGLYRASLDSQGTPKFELVVSGKSYAASTAFADSQGRLWFGLEHDLIEINQERMITYGAADEVGEDLIVGIVEDDQERLVVSSQHALFEFERTADLNAPGKWHRLPLTLARDQKLGRMAAEGGGALLIATNQGLLQYHDSQRKLFTTEQGLSDNEIMDLSWDVEGNLWVGTWSGGVCKLSNRPITSFTQTEGLPETRVVWVTGDREGGVYASTSQHGLLKIVEGRAVPIPGSQLPPFNTISSRILQDSRGDWWIGTDYGLFRVHGPELRFDDTKRFTRRDRVSAETIALELCEDAGGNLWFATASNVYWFDQRRQGAIQFRVRPAENSRISIPNHLACDWRGAVWLGTQGQLGRLVNGKVTIIATADGLPETNPRAFFLDSRGWLWIGLRYKGVSVTKNPNAEIPQFMNYSTANGLASDTVWSITEDDFGRMYFGTGRGLDRLDLTTGRVRHFTVADGLAADLINHCIKDRYGNIWSATDAGLSRLDPRAEYVNNLPPPIYLSRVQIAGEDLPLAETGAQQLRSVELTAPRNNLVIEYIGLDFQGERVLRYQYKLEGTDGGWSAATDQRSVNFARLAPGSYRFLVRAINSEGLMSADPAVFEFRILPPLWLRWWFLLLVAMFGGMTVYMVYRYRVRRLLELERVRSRIASDLHDDIGSNLSVIAGLTDLLRRHTDSANPETNKQLSLIAAVSQRSLEAMSDIVWAVNPQKDHLVDLTQRLRLFADEALFTHHIEFRFSGIDAAGKVRIGAETRREVFLIFKEAVNNIIRHSGCAIVDVCVKLDHRTLVLEIRDDGKGFDPELVRAGEGLASMRRRAEKIGARIDVLSKPGPGSTVRLRVPLGGTM
jgi:ligand-binding sensor domain-containing protein/signal transduction histidine kinase